MPTERVPIQRAPVQLTAIGVALADGRARAARAEGEPAELFFMDLRELWVERRAIVLPLSVASAPRHPPEPLVALGRAATR